MKKIFFSIAIFFSLAIAGNAQNTFPASGSVGIGTTSPNGSSLLEVKSTTKGLLIPRMTQAQRNAIGAPATGLLVFQTDVAPTFYWYTGSGWKSVGGAGRDLANLIGTTAINSSLLPASSGAIDLGSSSKKWRNGYFSGSVSAGSVTAGSSGVSIGVSGTGGTYGVYGYSSGGYGVFGNSGYLGVYGNGGTWGTYGVGGNYGAYGYSSSGNGVYGSTSSGYAVYGAGGPYGVYGNGSSYGVWGNSSYLGVYGIGDSYGTYGYSAAGTGATGYSSTGTGVYGSSGSSYGASFYSSSSWGIRAETNTGYYAGVFYGNIYTSQMLVTSDQNLKKNIQDFSGAMSIINKLKPKYYEFKDDAKLASLHLPKGNHYGLLAQDLEQVLPNLVHESAHELNINAAVTPEVGKNPNASTDKKVTKESINIKAVNYTELIPVLIKAMQELGAKNEDLQNQLTELKSLISKSGNGLASSANGYLKQNVPNPSSNNNTIISYYLPENTVRAQIRLTDAKGSLIKVYNATKGEGQLSIRSGELPAGTYNYSLYAGNKQIDSKQMVITR